MKWGRKPPPEPPKPAPRDIVAEIPMARLDAVADRLKEALAEFDRVRADARIREGDEDD